MRHLQPRPPEPTFHIEPLIRLATIQYTLITTHLLRDEIQRLNQLQPQLLPLLIFGYRNVFDMAYKAKVVDTVFDPSLARCLEQEG